MGGQKSGVSGSVPLEKQKTDIIDVLDKMHSNMREYAMDFEESLQQAHAAIGGGVKKFGFENVQRNSDGEQFLPEKFDRDLEKMNRHASNFIKNEATLPPKPDKQYS